ncbi:MAG: hypothetical protein AAGH15_24790 [Myxococcota bacterium]
MIACFPPRALPLLAGALALLAACGDTVVTVGDGMGSDAGAPDAGIDAGRDLGVDAGAPDAGIDAGRDLGIDAGAVGCVPERCAGVCLPEAYDNRCAAACERTADCPSVGGQLCAPVDFDDDADGSIDRVELACVSSLGGDALAASCRPATEQEDCASRACVSRVCTEGCVSADDCLPGMVCAATTDGPGMPRVCAFDIRSGIVDLDLGAFDLTGGRGRRVAFALPPNARSVTLLASYAGGIERPIAYGSADDATGRRIYDLEDISTFVDSPIRWIVGDTEEVATMLVPNTTADRVALVRGRLEATVFALGDPADTRVTSVSLRARILRGPAPSEGQLELDVHLGPGLGLSASTAGRNARVRGTLDRASGILAAQGLRLNVGGARYFDVGGARFEVIDSTDGTESELSELFRTSRPDATARVSIFLVRSIDGGSGFSTLGVAGAIPGPAGLPGTGESGVVLAFDEAVIGEAEFAGQVLAHELGHFLGLFHVTERLDACGAGETPPGCAPFGGGDVLADTTTGDERNLMHWTPTMTGGRPNVRLSAGQGFVLLRNPLTQGP